jgi:hypothetical protein
LIDPEERKEATRLYKAAQDIASQLYDIHLTGAREDAFRSPMKLYGRLSALASDIGASGIDFRPTDQQGEVYEILNKRLQIAREGFEQLMDKEVTTFNQKLNDINYQINLEKKSDD